jgi:putative phosphonate metabolism protein
MPEPSTARYALYYTPPREHPLTVTASAWLGRDAFAPEAPAASQTSQAALTLNARRYGFHATLKPPFRLRDGASCEDLEQALSGFASACPQCPLGPLKVALMGDFLALVPADKLPQLGDFASRIVEEFDRFRAPLNQAELQRRLSRPLDEVEMKNLTDWGYPYVFERFRFHMSLTDRIPASLHSKTHKQLESIFQPFLQEYYTIDTLSLFVQEHPGADFIIRSQFALKTPD